MIANLGYGTLIITFVVSLYGALAAIYGVRSNKPAWVDSCPQCYAAHLSSDDPDRFKHYLPPGQWSL